MAELIELFNTCQARMQKSTCVQYAGVTAFVNPVCVLEIPDDLLKDGQPDWKSAQTLELPSGPESVASANLRKIWQLTPQQIALLNESDKYLLTTKQGQAHIVRFSSEERLESLAQFNAQFACKPGFYKAGFRFPETCSVWLAKGKHDDPLVFRKGTFAA